MPLIRSTCKIGSKEIKPDLISLNPGLYRIELWGASGGGPKNYTGKGGYAVAVIAINETTQFLFYIGGRGEFVNRSAIGGCNGGGDGHYGSLGVAPCGGGSTDLRLNQSLDSRILVASGGGGNRGNKCIGGSGGASVGFSVSCIGVSGGGANQTNGGFGGKYYTNEGQSGGKLYGGYAIGFGYSGGGGGGGFYGGGGSYEGGGGGGSGYISPKLNGSLKSGQDPFPSPTRGIEIGHEGDGAVRITMLPDQPSKHIRSRNNIFLSIMLFLQVHSP